MIQTPGMTKEVLSPTEERFERWRRNIGFFFGPLVFLILYFTPIPSLSQQAHTLAAILGLAIIFWISEAIPIPVTAILGAILNVILGVAPAKEVFAPFADPIVFLFIGSFIIAEAITLHHLDKRFAFAIFSLKFIGENPYRVLFACGVISAIISMWMSNTAATAMMLPITLGVLKAMDEAHREAGRASNIASSRYATGMMLIIAYGASVGGIATPIGTPPNLIGIGFIQNLTGTKITFFEWMQFALPLTIIMFVFLYLLIRFLHPPEIANLRGIKTYVQQANERLGAWSGGEINTALAFMTAVFLWIFPSLVSMILGKDAVFSKFLGSRLDEGVVAVLAASLLFILPVNWKEKRFTMNWKRAVRIDWGTILLFGGGLSLGRLMFSTGLADVMGKGLTGITGASNLWGITAAGTFLAIIISETTSNTASANMVVPIIIALAKGADVSPIPPAIGACLGASFGFMLPVSTPPNAIVYGSGLVPILRMVRAGIVFDILGFLIIVGGLMLLCPLMGWV
ncbi:MAG: anion transporter [Deltaproteobacteria bacterium RIFCSPLOWO2_12_FULL_43_16]|nr:MAG: anion transporter [Deltaproteobacteria bacterium GWA2_43_19]OGQ13058.1 MAG: anion transporter [Deltaproteobacteria bacterium RIFCSPHIGHO2_02_FULL_43_33]OGQ59710.1 MAG: anion transporter [Deltaproteobacteria bacterium RIFCSPLOWO2_12_FULL_43_16]HBR18169.1 anion transporter [Deltaproteobacteria bacterium]